MKTRESPCRLGRGERTHGVASEVREGDACRVLKDVLEIARKGEGDRSIRRESIARMEWRVQRPRDTFRGVRTVLAMSSGEMWEEEAGLDRGGLWPHQRAQVGTSGRQRGSRQGSDVTRFGFQGTDAGDRVETGGGKPT